MSRSTRPRTRVITRWARPGARRQEAYYRTDWARFRKADRAALVGLAKGVGR